MEDMFKFEMPKHQSSIIKVLGVGGGGSNAVNHMHHQGISGVDFIVCNTDAQALDMSPVPNKIALGEKGLGAGCVPMVAEKAALEKADEIRELLSTNTEMLFITAGMGGGTGTGAAPVIARIAKEIELKDEDVKKILVVAIVTLPFSFEGRKRKQQAETGINELRKHADAVLIISNDKLREQYGNLGILEGFKIADNVLLTAAKGIAEIITVKAYINIDFKDVNTVMRDSGVAIMGTGIASGENRAMQAVEEAIRSPLLNDNDITGAQNILLYLSSFEKDISFDEITEITEYITSKAGPNVDVIWGAGQDPTLGDKISVTIVATGFDKEPEKPAEPTKYDLYSQGNRERENDEVGVPRPTRPAAEPMLIVEEDEDLDEIRLISNIEEGVQKKDPPMMPVSEVDDEEKLTDREETNTTEASPMAAASDSPVAENKPEIIRFSLDDPMPEPEKRESITEVSEPTNSTVEAEPEESAYYEQEAKLRTIERQDIEPGLPEDRESAEKRHKERIEKLRQMSIKLRSPGGLNELEDVPAYRRKNVELSDEKPSEESQVSRYTLSDEDEGTTLKDNPFLHDNVD